MQFILCTLAAFAFARFEFWGRDVLFALVLIQLMVSPDILILENYITIRSMGLVDTLPAIALPYLASAFGIFLLRQTFKSIPKDFEEAARVEGCSTLGSSGGSISRSASRSISPTASSWCRSTGTTTCGR